MIPPHDYPGLIDMAVVIAITGFIALCYGTFSNKIWTIVGGCIIFGIGCHAGSLVPLSAIT